MSKESNSATSGIGLPSILTIIFVIAKLFGKISWSWWWVFSPLWIGASIFIAVLLAILLFLIFTLFWD